MSRVGAGIALVGGSPTFPTMILINRMVALTPTRPEQIALRAGRSMFLKRRWRGVAEDGTEFGFDLDSRLKSGCVFHQTDAADYVIWQDHEPVYQIPFQSAEQAALIGWKIGNLHFPVQIMDGMIRVTQDLAITQLCEREGWDITEATVEFHPLRVTAHAS